ncbi:hemerythrin domain-containing protein [Mesorhizobium sp. ANAO-SY3R2]|uniref:hemerythrin domain-containing protein n=1 Tax=Mesorhizobium sp. ANAO-SY3R2 TaxID=3166644 RepID=UPI00366C3738
MTDFNSTSDLNGRYDIYGAVHKGLRKTQCELLPRLGSADFSIPQVALLTELRALLTLAASHVQHEDHHIHNALKARGAVSVERLDHQHDDHRKTFAELEAIISEIEKAPAAKRPALGRRLYLAFSAYVAHDLEHMFEEETVAAPQLWSLFTDAELAEIENRIVGSLPPEKSMAFMQIMIPASRPDERAAMLGGMKQHAPREAFDAVMEFAARPKLSAAEFADLVRRLDLVA